MGRLDYLKQYQSHYTVQNYSTALKDFFESKYGQRKPLEDLAEKYFAEQRSVEEDVKNFLVHLQEKRLAPKNVRLKIASIRVFLTENDVELPRKFWKRISGRIKGSRALTLDKVPSNEELRKIIMHMQPQGKALYLVLASSGIRIGEALQLKLEDIELGQDPARISVRGEYTKSGNSRVAFMSREAKEIVQEWLKIRGEYLQAAAGKSHIYDKSVEDQQLFPFKHSTAYHMWNSSLRKTGNGKRDERTRFHKIHPHVLRKFFRTRMGAVIPTDVVEALMGHEGYLTEVYRRYSVEDLAKFYKQGEHALLVFTEAAEVGRLRQEIEERNRQLQMLVNGLTTENLELKSRMAKVELELTGLKKALEKLIG